MHGPGNARAALNPSKSIRTLGSGMTFLGFGALGLLTSLIVVPLLYLLPGGRRSRERRALSVVHHGFRVLVAVFGLLRLIRVEHADVQRETPLTRSVIISNHPTYIDIVVLLSRLPEAVCMVKDSVWNNPCMGPIVRTAGFIPNRDATYFLEKAAQSITEGKSVIIFPEGTRSRVDGLQVFQRGAAQLALRTGSAITPVLLFWRPPTLQRGSKWHQMSDCPLSRSRNA